MPRRSAGPDCISDRSKWRRRSPAISARTSRSGEVLGTEALDLPPSRLVTRGVWYTVEPADLAGAASSQRHGPARCTRSSMRPSASCPCSRSATVGTSAASPPLARPTRNLPTIVIYDGYPGGAGIAELGYDAADRHLATTLEVIEGCGCTDGCPSCIQSPKCGNWNEPLDKAGSIALLRHVLDSVSL